MKILAFEKGRRLAFTWNSPPAWPEVRRQRAVVDVTLRPEGDADTRVVLRRMGRGDGEDRAAVHAYFDGAWKVVLSRLVYRAIHGAIDWDNPPEGLLYGGVE